MIRLKTAQKIYSLGLIESAMRFFEKPMIRHMTPKKMANYLLIEREFHKRKPDVQGFPYHISIDPINACNLRCPLCFTGQETALRPKSVMPLGIFQSLIDELSDYLFDIELYNWGEPFLHPNIFEMVACAQSKNIGTRISSNLNRLKPDFPRYIIESGLEELIVSCDGATQEIYQKYRVRGSLPQVLENVHLVLEEKRKVRSRFPKVVLQFIVMRHNEHEIDNIHKLSKEIGVDLLHIHPVIADVKNPVEAERWLPQNESLSRYDYISKELKPEFRWPKCDWLWRRATINADGGVSPCCWLEDPELDFGNLHNSSFAELWRNQAYASARSVFWKQTDHTTKTICHECKGNPLPTQSIDRINVSGIT